MRGALALALLLAGCGSEAPPAATGAGARLEAAATELGMVADPAHAPLTGSWARETDRACVVPGEGRAARIGVLIDYGEGQGCTGTGSVERDGAALKVTFGDCRIAARFDGERIVFPPEVPAECERLCAGRASLAAFAVERVSGSASEASTLRTPSGRSLCGA